ncbi:MAG TPA: cytoplasmic protein [Erysipelotrichaceae bacterium]|nr:cytoplasmic protein [Erysipelotrichaceae bacterium]
MTFKDGFEAHKYSSANKKILEKEKKCGCFYCGAIFSPDEIYEWCEDTPDWTAICLYCGIDSLTGESIGYPLTEDSLKVMHRIWF